MASTVDAIILDVEKWSYTPVAEQQDPVSAYKSAYTALQKFNAKCRTNNHEKPVILIATPGTDLVTAVTDQGNCKDAIKNDDQFHAYQCLNLAGGIAPYCDQYEVQAQACQTDESEYEWFVKQSAQQVQAVNPRMPLMAGLAADPARLPTCSAEILFTDVQNTFGTVGGYWLNVIPGTDGGACPKNESVGAVAASLLNLMHDD